MKVSVDRLRWGLAGAVVLLLVGLVAAVSYGHWAAARKWKDLLAKNGIHISQESDNVTYSQTVQGRTVFTLRAKKAIPISNGKYTLRGVTLLLYGKNSNSVDRVEGDQFEYDEKSGVAKAIGEVQMDIQAPGALVRQKGSPQAPPGAGGAANLDQETNVIHVLTSGLVYLRKLGVAATDQRVEFRYAGLTCVSKGAEFDTNDNALHLLADVEMTGELHGQPAVVHAARADMDRDKNTIAVVQPVASSRGESARSASALLELRPDGSLQHATAGGGVLLESAARHVAAQRLEATFGAQSAPQRAVLSGGVTLEGSAAKPLHGTAVEADLAFTPAGAISGVVAKGSVRLVSGLVKPGVPALARELRGEQVTARFRVVGNGKQTVLQEVHAVGGAFARGESLATAKPGAKALPGVATSGIVTTQVSADDLLAEFAAVSTKGKNANLQHLTGQGHARLQQNGLNGAEEVSSSDTLDAAFAPESRGGSGLGSGAGGALRLQTAVQTGHVQIRDQAAAQGAKRGALSTAHGDRATLDGATDRLTLTGGAAYQQEGTSLSANSVSVEQSSGNAEAQGNVEASLASADRDATHVLADHGRLARAAQTAEFFGTDAHPARMWQGGSQVMAANLYLDDAKQSLTAKPAAAGGMVEAVFAAEARSGVAKVSTTALQRKQSGGEAVHVSSPALSYSGLRREAVCTGGVRVREGDMQVHAQQAVMFLGSTPAPSAGLAAGAKTDGGKPIGGGLGQMGGSLERMVLTGSVRLDEPGRAGDGEQLVYTAKDGSYLLTGAAGKPPRVADAAQGMVTGPALLFRSGEKSVIVTGAAASNGHDAGGRVHTEVNVRPQER